MENWLFNGLLPEHRNYRQTDFLSEPDGLQISYLQLEKRTAQFANALLSLGLKPDDRVAVCCDKCVDVLLLYLATIRAGGVFLPINTANVVSEVEYFLADATPLIFICDPIKASAYTKILETSAIQLLTLDAEGEGSWLLRCNDQSENFENVARSRDDLAAILYTSGTTGRSKGAMLTHNNLLSNAKSLLSCWHYQSNDVLLHALPIYHTHGLFVAVNLTLVAGASMIFLKSFDAELVCRWLPLSTVMMGVPTFYTRLMATPAFTAKVCENNRLFISGSAPLLEQDHHQFESHTGHVILERYGMTETNMITSNPYQGKRKPGTVGLALPQIEVRIVDPVSHQLKQCDETGMIEVKGPNVFIGYWNMPDKTATEFTQDGFFITGDLGTEDVEGYISIVGRDKDLIISGGLNIYPKDLEQVIDACECVVESAVIGIADADFGEAVVAIVVLQPRDNKERYLNQQLAEIQIKTATKKNLAGYKRPKQLFFVEELPRNTMGKVQKNRLRERYA